MSINSKDLVLKLLKRQVVKVENINKEIFELAFDEIRSSTMQEDIFNLKSLPEPFQLKDQDGNDVDVEKLLAKGLNT